jgi:general secretion pathway protein C
MLLLIQRHFKGLFLLLFALLGIAAGHFISTALGIYLVPSAREPGIVSEERAVTRQKPSLADFEIVLRRNIFDSTSPGAATLKSPQREPERVAPAAKTAAKADLKLLGTVSAEDGSLALIGAGRSMDLYRVGDDVPGGGTIGEIARNLVTIQYRDGSLEVLSLYDTEQATSPPSSAGPPPSAATAGESEKVKPIGDNQWVIDRRAAENARKNIGELLKSARMEPNLVNGNTEGFVVKMIQPGSLLADLGIRKGDVILEVNGVELASPEKALQIFQQLREARHISIGLQRDGTPMNFDYEIN